jgi:hypothetical protein
MAVLDLLYQQLAQREDERKWDQLVIGGYFDRKRMHVETINKTKKLHAGSRGWLSLMP